MAGQLWRVVAAYRLAALGYAAVLIARDLGSYAHPAAGLAVLAAMAAWTAVTVLAYSRPAGRSRWLLAADVAVACAAVLSTRLVETASRIGSGAPTLSVAWAAAPVLACALAGGPAGGLAGAAAVAAADLAERQDMSQATFNGIVLLFIAGVVGGYVVRLTLRAEAATEDATRREKDAAGREATAAERVRLARGIHDSVLQVLALVSSRGTALGGEAAELGRLAAEQEAALRRLVSGTDGDRANADSGAADLAGMLAPLASHQVTLSCPADPVLLPGPSVRALAGATREALANVGRHAGTGARAWILVEDDGSAVTVSIRDDGAGFADGRLAEAEAAGRLGVAQSIVGRLREAGGSARLVSAPGQGTEVELRVPRT